MNRRYRKFLALAAIGITFAAPAASQQGRYVDLPGVSVFMIDSGGEGETVILLHPRTGNSAYWQYTVPALAEEAERRNINFVNPTLKDFMPGAALPTLRGGIQLLLPDEQAYSHRHSANAFRLVLDPVDLQVAYSQNQFLLPPRPAQQGANPRLEFRKSERFHQVVIRPPVQPQHPIIYLVAGR